VRERGEEGEETVDKKLLGGRRGKEKRSGLLLLLTLFCIVSTLTQPVMEAPANVSLTFPRPHATPIQKTKQSRTYVYGTPQALQRPPPPPLPHTQS
jgi:hypothetical protein